MKATGTKQLNARGKKTAKIILSLHLYARAFLNIQQFGTCWIIIIIIIIFLYHFKKINECKCTENIS